MSSQRADNFVVSEVTTTTPTSDVTDDASSTDDSSCCDIPGGGDVTMEHRMYIVNRAGSGEASYFLLSPDGQHIASYRLRREVWRPIVDITNFGLAVLHNCIYVIGGFDRRHARHLSCVFRFDPSQGTWTACASLNVARAKFGVCAYGNNIFVCGGEKSDGRVTGSCEMYDCQTDNWTKTAILPQPRANPVCAAHGRELFCAGGYFGNTSHKNLWMNENLRWGEVDEHYPHVLPYCLDRCALATFDNTIYFIGGVMSRLQDKRDERPTFSTERRVFSYNTKVSALGAKKQQDNVPGCRNSDLISPWNLKLPSMIFARHSAGAVALGHKIYVIGGTSLETGQPVTTAEYLDTRTGVWEEDFNFRKGDVSSVICTHVAVPKIPVSERKMAYRLKWVMW